MNDARRREAAIGFPFERVSAAKRYIYALKPWWSRFGESMTVTPIFVPAGEKWGGMTSTDRDMRLFIDHRFATNAPFHLLAGAIELQFHMQARDVFRRLQVAVEKEENGMANICFDMEVNSAISMENESLTMHDVEEICARSYVFPPADLDHWDVQAPPGLEDHSWSPEMFSLPPGKTAETYYRAINSPPEDQDPLDEPDDDSDDSEDQDHSDDGQGNQEQGDQSQSDESGNEGDESQERDQQDDADDEQKSSDQSESSDDDSNESGDESDQDKSSDESDSGSPEQDEPSSDEEVSGDDESEQGASADEQDDSQGSDESQDGGDSDEQQGDEQDQDGQDEQGDDSADGKDESQTEQDSADGRKQGESEDCQEGEESDGTDSEASGGDQSPGGSSGNPSPSDSGQRLDAAQQESVKEQIEEMMNQSLDLDWSANALDFDGKQDNLWNDLRDEEGADFGIEEKKEASLEELADDVQHAARYGNFGLKPSQQIIDVSNQVYRKKGVDFASQFTRLLSTNLESMKISGGSDLSYSVPNPNQPRRGPILMGLYTTAPNIMAMIDVSGSMLRWHESAIGSFMDLSEQALSRYGDKINWITADVGIVDIGRSVDVGGRKGFGNFQFGTGGTNFGTVIEDLVSGKLVWKGKRYKQPDLLPIITDCEFKWPWQDHPTLRTKTRILVVSVKRYEDIHPDRRPKWFVPGKNFLYVPE